MIGHDRVLTRGTKELRSKEVMLFGGVLSDQQERKREVILDSALVSALILPVSLVKMSPQ